MRISDWSSDVCSSDLSLPAYLHLAILMIGFFVKLIIWPKKLGRADMYDLVIRGGTVVDGSGGAPFVADVAIDGDRIVAVGENLGAGSENIDASGKIVTPGFVDVHTHYDGQATSSEEHTSELQSLMRISYDVFRLKKK